jgi:stress response protein YsnF
MTRTVTALFDTRQEAEAAKARLQSSNIDADRIRVIDKDSTSSSSTSSSSSGSTSGDNKGFFSSLTDMFMPDEDRHAYSEGISRGGFLVCAQVDEHEADQAIQILEESNSVDFDERQEQWRGDGWAGWTGGTMNNQGVSSGQMAAGYNQQQPQQQQAFQATGQAGQFGSQEHGRVVQEEHIPLVEEELRVGKREVNRGSARVRSFVREVPVHEQVSLREEHVDVERRPVSGERIDPARASEMLQDRTIEMTETSEEAVVGKEARVTEEVVVARLPKSMSSRSTTPCAAPKSMSTRAAATPPARRPDRPSASRIVTATAPPMPWTRTSTAPTTPPTAADAASRRGNRKGGSARSRPFACLPCTARQPSDAAPTLPESCN